MIYAYIAIEGQVLIWGTFILAAIFNLIPFVKELPSLIERGFELFQQGVRWSTTFEKPELKESEQGGNSIEMEVTKPVSKPMPVNQKIQDQFKLEQEKHPSLNMIDFLKVHYPAIAEQWKEFEK